jgi:hypothetical protein
VPSSSESEDVTRTAWTKRWRHYDLSKRRQLFTGRYGVTSHKNWIFVTTAVIIPNLEQLSIFRWILAAWSYSCSFEKIPNSVVQFTGVRWYGFIPEGKPVNKGTYINFFRRGRSAVRRKRPEKWRTKSGFYIMTMPQHTGRFRSKEKCDTTGAPSVLSWPVFSWYLSVPSAEISIEGTGLLWSCWYH